MALRPAIWKSYNYTTERTYLGKSIHHLPGADMIQEGASWLAEGLGADRRVNNEAQQAAAAREQEQKGKTLKSSSAQQRKEVVGETP